MAEGPYTVQDIKDGHREHARLVATAEALQVKAGELAGARADVDFLSTLAGQTMALRDIDLEAGESLVVSAEISEHALFVAMRETIRERDAALKEVARLNTALVNETDRSLELGMSLKSAQETVKHLAGEVAVARNERDENERKGKLLCQQNGELLIREHDLKTTIIDVTGKLAAATTRAETDGEQLAMYMKAFTDVGLALQGKLDKNAPHQLQARLVADLKAAHDDLMLAYKRQVEAGDIHEKNSEEASEVFETLFKAGLIPPKKPGPHLSEVVADLLNHLQFEYAVDPAKTYADTSESIDDLYARTVDPDGTSLDALCWWVMNERERCKAEGKTFDTGFRAVSEGKTILYFDPEVWVDDVTALRICLQEVKNKLTPMVGKSQALQKLMPTHADIDQAFFVFEAIKDSVEAISKVLGGKQ